jgi:hypothetical protein
MQVRNKELTFSKGQELLLSLAEDCEDIREARYIEAARDSILDYEKKFNEISIY